MKFERILAIEMVVLTGLCACSQDTRTSEQDYFELSPGGTQVSFVPIRIESLLRDPVLTRGAPGTWDSIDVLNPSVIRFQNQYFNYYSGFDGKMWQTGLATSSDGVHWSKYDANPVLSPGQGDWDERYIAANGSAVVFRGKILYFYHGVSKEGRAKIGLAVSTDGIHFSNRANPVFDPGRPHSWESQAVADPYLLERSGVLYMYYLGVDDLGTQRLGIARSTDGVRWSRSLTNPILDVGAAGSFDEFGLGEPSVVFAPPYFYLLYTGRSRDELRNLGYAVSTDGVHWKKMSSVGLIAEAQRSAWDSKVICDSTILPRENGRYTVWFGGGDKPQPAENLDGQIGMMSIDLSQGRNQAEFDANADWSTVRVASTDVLRGSFTIDGDMGRRQAWIGPSAYASFPIDQTIRGKSLNLRAWVPVKMLSKAAHANEKDHVAIIINGKEAAYQDFSEDTVFDLTVPWNKVEAALSGSEIADIEIRSSLSMVPADSGFGPDTRRLSMRVTSLRFEQK